MVTKMVVVVVYCGIVLLCGSTIYGMVVWVILEKVSLSVVMSGATSVVFRTVYSTLW